MDLVELERAEGARHPWEQARLAFFSALLGRELGRGGVFLDVGAGDGWFARKLVERGLADRVTCWDTGYTPALLARHGLAPDGRVAYVQARPAGRFDVVLLLDVLEHVGDDAGLLAAVVAENLEPGGHALLSVPAWPALFSGHDVALRHVRRYRPAALRALAVAAGLRLVARGGLFHALVPARALAVLRERVAPRPAALPAPWRAPAPVTALVQAALAADTALTRALLSLGLSLPGLSTWVLCQKPPRS